nr:unnamed protein product [Callosobruchus chinensis]
MMLLVPCAENISALWNGFDVTLVLLGDTNTVSNILGLVNLYAIFVKNTYVLLCLTLRTLCQAVR